MDRTCKFCGTAWGECGTKETSPGTYHRSAVCVQISTVYDWHTNERIKCEKLEAKLDFIASSVRPMFMEISGKMTRLLVLDLGGADQKTRNEGFIEEVNAAMKEVKR